MQKRLLALVYMTQLALHNVHLLACDEAPMLLWFHSFDDTSWPGKSSCADVVGTAKPKHSPSAGRPGCSGLRDGN